ncbi:hypothetical protein BJV74DRAFT_116375 [Russula compacta]|nr:hypothetical protein BJV74DRAFT_116375 [Russula compacta]
MTDMSVKIMAEVLSILAIATKDIKQGRIKKYIKRLIGRTDIEDALKRLDKLTLEEARMVTAQLLKATHAVDNKVAVVIDDGKEAKEVIQQAANDVDQVKRELSHNLSSTHWRSSPILPGNQLRENVRKWLSPPDPSTNHNIACGAHLKRAATWFLQGGIFEEWKSTGSLLWIHGKPGSGKSILCSTIIQDIEVLCEAGEASLSYFYFDFRDTNKQHLHDLVTSLLTQLSASSLPRSDILSRLFSTHDSGARQPSDDVLTRSLKEMLALPEQCPVYLIMDALDECPDTSGIPSPRELVLQLVKDLVDLHLPNLHICVTSRPEIDIRHVLEPLTSLQVSLHDQSGQKEDIANYVRSIVYSDSERIMGRWRAEDKELVIETLSERADGIWKVYVTVFHQVSGVHFQSYQNPWTRPMSVY